MENYKTFANNSGVAMDAINDIEKSIKKHIPQNYLSTQFEIIKNYILKSQQQAKELAELKKSDESKEQSSIDYYNEMKKYKKELAELKEENKKWKKIKLNNTLK